MTSGLTLAGTANGLNQLTQYGAKSLTHDGKGNVTAFGTKSFTYSSENLLLTGPNATTLQYDPVMRLDRITSGTAVKLAYDGLDRIAEYDGSNTLLRRYVHGPGVDEPIVWYEGSGTTDRRFLSSDERGSIISVTNSSGAVLGLNKFDEFGRPDAANLGAFGYTGQAWLPSMSVWYYKARVYEPELGRFLQPDPIEYAGGANLYAYVLNDPVNWIDPLGLDPEGDAYCDANPLECVWVQAKSILGGGSLPPPRESRSAEEEAITIFGIRLKRPDEPRNVPVRPAPRPADEDLDFVMCVNREYGRSLGPTAFEESAVGQSRMRLGDVKGFGSSVGGIPMASLGYAIGFCSTSQ